MKINILALGKSKQSFIENGLQEYLKRLSKYVQISFIELPDIKLTKSNTIKIVKNKEAEILLRNINERDFVIALDENGKQFSSIDFAKYLEELKTKPNLVFIIGGVYGLSNEVVERANLVLSFSKFTFTHQMIRLLLIEQIYRSFTILEGKKYHY
jgi:23S rRNA (pseudouridine1915-N3)-methyltransferase